MATYGLDKISTTYDTSYFVDEMIRVGRPFKVARVIIPLAQAITSSMSIVVKIFLDDGSSNVTIGTINNTNFQSKRSAEFRPQACQGVSNFYIQLEINSTALSVIGLPLVTEVEIITE